MQPDDTLRDTLDLSGRADAETGASLELAVTRVAATPGLSQPGARGELDVDAVGQRAMLAKVASPLPLQRVQ